MEKFKRELKKRNINLKDLIGDWDETLIFIIDCWRGAGRD
jgi:predicted protein tyrosine phosphatase